MLEVPTTLAVHAGWLGSSDWNRGGAFVWPAFAAGGSVFGPGHRRAEEGLRGVVDEIESAGQKKGRASKKRRQKDLTDMRSLGSVG